MIRTSILLLSLITISIQEPDDVIVKILYKPKDCQEVGQRGDKMHVQYLGRFFDSRETFDSSYNRDNVPFQYTLAVGGVIEGYQIGTKNMCINERRRLIVPSKYAYGSSGTGSIPPHATLMFDVHLVQINDSPPKITVPLEMTTEVNVEGSKDCDHPIAVGDVVQIEYVGALPDGTVFDKSEKPVKFVVGSSQIMQGIDIGVVSFCKDSKLEMEIPPTKAYGDQWDGPVPQWSFVYYSVSVTHHSVSSLIEDGNLELACETLDTPSNCGSSYKIQKGDYISLEYKVKDLSKVDLGEGNMRYPVGRKVLVPGWDQALVGACVGERKLCWIPGSLAHPKGISLFLAPPEKAFYSELTVKEVLLTYSDNKDAQDLREISASDSMVVDESETDKNASERKENHVEL